MWLSFEVMLGLEADTTHSAPLKDFSVTAGFFSLLHQTERKPRLHSSNPNKHDKSGAQGPPSQRKDRERPSSLHNFFFNWQLLSSAGSHTTLPQRSHVWYKWGLFPTHGAVSTCLCCSAVTSSTIVVYGDHSLRCTDAHICRFVGSTAPWAGPRLVHNRRKRVLYHCNM